MVKIINKRKHGNLFHYAHFFCDCLYPEIVNHIYKHKHVFRLKTIHQTLGNFKDIYQNVMNNKSIELLKEDFNKLTEEIIVINDRFNYTDDKSLSMFKEYIFNRYLINPLVYDIHYPEVVLIKRGDRRSLIDDEYLSSINENVTNGKERREIKDIEQVESTLIDMYGIKFKSFYLENETFHEQIKIFNNAKIIILAYGAAMCNMFFCKAGTTIIEITCDKKWPFFDIVSKNSNLNHIKITTNNAPHIISFLNKHNSEHPIN